MMNLKGYIKYFFLAFVQLLFLCTVVYADVLPQTSDDIPCGSIGLYQTDTRLMVYENPDSNSKLLFDKEIIYQNMIGVKKDDTFGVLIPKKGLGYLYVVDTSDDENWVKVIYDKKENKTGWVYKNDDFQFMPWFDFINIYGRKYGIYKLKNNSKNDNIFSNPSEDAQTLGKIMHPKTIRLTSVEGNWFLVTLLDISGDTITGYIVWRSADGQIFYFPNIK